MRTFLRNVSLSDYTTFKVGGPAEFFATVTSEAELLEMLVYAREQKIPVRLIGGGSNVLAPDEGLSGITLRNMISGWEERSLGDRIRVTVGSGEVLDQVVEYAVSKNYWGLENLSHIPGSVGATPVQNVGAYGVEIADLIKEVRAVHIDSLAVKTFDASSCCFGYRDSFFKTPEGKKYFITAVTLDLSCTPNPQLEYRDLRERFSATSTPSLVDIRTAIIEIRSAKFPDWKKIGTAGSFFKNPIIAKTSYEKLLTQYPDMPGFIVSDLEVKIPLGWILDKVCNLRGVTKGNVGTFAAQALVLVNNGLATAREVTSFAEYIGGVVEDKTGITIEWEVTKLM